MSMGEGDLCQGPSLGKGMEAGTEYRTGEEETTERLLVTKMDGK